MIRTVMVTQEGPLVILGIVGENVRRLQQGMPIEVDITDLLDASSQGREIGENERLRIAIAYGDTHRAIIEGMDSAVPGVVPPGLLAAAEQLDAQLREEGLL